MATTTIPTAINTIARTTSFPAAVAAAPHTVVKAEVVGGTVVEVVQILPRRWRDARGLYDRRRAASVLEVAGEEGLHRKKQQAAEEEEVVNDHP